MRVVRGIGALGVLLGILVGAPVLLWHGGRLDALSRLWRDFPQVLLTPDDGSVLLGLLSVLGWLAWAVFTLAVLGELVALLGRRRFTLPGLGRPQAWVSGLLMAVLALASAQAVAQAQPNGPPSNDPGTQPTWSRATAPQPVQPEKAQPQKPQAAKPQTSQPAQPAQSASVSQHEHQTDRPLSPEPTLARAPDGTGPAAAPEGPAPQQPVVAFAPTSERAVEQPTASTSPTATPTLSPAERIALATAGISALSAAAMLSTLAVRRRVQLIERPLGVLLPRVDPTAQLLEQAMGQAADPLTSRSLDLALRALGRHCREAGQRLPAIGGVLVSDERISIDVDRMPVALPPGFHAEGRRLWIGCAEGAELAALPGIEAEPAPCPGLVCLGELVATMGSPESGTLLFHDLETIGILGLQGNPTIVSEALDALLLELASSSWGAGHEVVVVGGSAELIGALDNPAVTPAADLDTVLSRLENRLRQRPPASAHPRDLRTDATTDEAWRLCTLLIFGAVDERQRDRLEWLCADRAVAAVVADDRFPHLELAAPPAASMLPNGGEFRAQLLTEPVRRNLVELFRATDPAGEQDPLIAPWWNGPPGELPESSDAEDADAEDDAELTVLRADDEAHLATRVAHAGESDSAAHRGAPSGSDQDLTGHRTTSFPAPTESPNAQITNGQISSGQINNVTALGPRRANRTQEDRPIMDSHEPTPHPLSHQVRDVPPTVLLIGPVDLVAARGPAPTRARRQCIEYCAWLLEHPNTNSSVMTNELFVAEGTRRSNMSRLRSWLGENAAGELYLPDAYSGRISLHAEVSSDWNRMQLLTVGGLDRSSDANLIEALELVRGAPIADGAPGQWHWAEELRSDISALVRDIGMVLASRALQRGEVDLARWAVNRALVAAAEDEQLLGVRLRLEHAAGNRHEVERIALRLVRQARRLNIDLSDETVELLQQVMEGGTRRRDLA